MRRSGSGMPSRASRSACWVANSGRCMPPPSVRTAPSSSAAASTVSRESGAPATGACCMPSAGTRPGSRTPPSAATGVSSRPPAATTRGSGPRRAAVLWGRSGLRRSRRPSRSGRAAVATGDDDGLVRVRGAASTVLRHADTVWDLDFDEDGRLLASASGDRSAQVWELATGQTIATLWPHPSVAVSARFTDRGRLLLTAGRDGAARLWAVEAERRLAVLPAESGTIGAIAVAADTGDVATAGGDGTVRVWTETGRAPAVRRSHSRRSRRDLFRRWDHRCGLRRRHGAALARRPTGQGHRASRGRRTRGGVLARRPDVGDERCRPPRPALGRRCRGTVGVLPGAASVEGVAFSPDGRMLATADADGRLDVWNVRARRLEFRLRWPRQSFRSVAVAPDGRIAVGTDAAPCAWPTSCVATGARLQTHTRAPSKGSPSHPTARPSSRPRSTGTRASGTRQGCAGREVASDRRAARRRGGSARRPPRRRRPPRGVRLRLRHVPRRFGLDEVAEGRLSAAK